MKYLRYTFALSVLCSILLISCSKTDSGLRDQLEGRWRCSVGFGKSKVPFIMEISGNENLQAEIRNGAEQVVFDAIYRESEKIVFKLTHYDAKINVRIKENGTLVGDWSKPTNGGRRSSMTFFAEKSDRPKFENPENEPDEKYSSIDISGEWAMHINDGLNEESQGIFLQNGSNLTGTVLTSLGDFGYLEGDFQNGQLRLSCFDGAHAYLLTGSITEEGFLEGEFHSNSGRPASWTAMSGKAIMPDPFTFTSLQSSNSQFEFSYPDSDMRDISQNDPSFEGKGLVVFVFGTWCVNSNDEAALLSQLQSQFADKNVAFVGFANEFTDGDEASYQSIDRFKSFYSLDFPVLNMGLADKKLIGEKLSLDKFHVYPTTFFIDKDRNVQKIYAGFRGPATGIYYNELRAEFEKAIEEIIPNN